MRWVLDASVAIQMVVPEEHSSLANALIADDFVVPDSYFSECTNVMWKKVARQQMSPEAAHIALAMLLKVKVETFATAPFASEALQVALTLNHPAYDCFYLVLAEQQGATLITADKRLFNRCQQPDAARWAGCIRLLGAHGAGA